MDSDEKLRYKEHEDISKLSIRNTSPNNFNNMVCFSERKSNCEISGRSSRNLTAYIKIRKNIEKLEKHNASKQKPLKLDTILPLKPPRWKSVPVKVSKYIKNGKLRNLTKKYMTIKGNDQQIALTKGSSKYLESNSKHRDHMEDYVNVIDSFNKNHSEGERSLYVLCDGHSGNDVAKIAIIRFPEIFKSLLINDIESNESEKDFIESCLIQTFRLLDEELVQYEEVGSTINIIFIQFEEGQRVIYSGNLGDSRSILIKNKEAIRLSYDHKAIDKNEIERVKKEGGIILRKRFYGALAITRALGDYTFKIDGCGLSTIPYITRTIIEKDDQFIIIGSDGIWDVINEEKAYKYIKDNKQLKDIELVSKFFVEESVRLGSKDNISCIAIKLN